MNKTLATILKIVGALAILCGAVVVVLRYLEKKGVITCSSGECLDIEDGEACETFPTEAEEEAPAEETSEAEPAEEKSAGEE